MKLRTFACLIVVLALAVGVAGCGKSDNNDNGQISAVEKAEGKGQETAAQKKQEAEHFSGEATPVPLLSGDLTGVRVNKPTVYVIHTRKAYNALVRRHNSHGVSHDVPPAVDWGTRQAVAVFLPPQKSGTILAINDVYPKDGKINITAVRLLPGKNCGNNGTKPRSFAIVETRNMKTSAYKLNLSNQDGQQC